MSTAENPIRPHLLAAYRGHHQVLRWGSTQTCPPLRTPPSLTSWPPNPASPIGRLQGPPPGKKKGGSTQTCPPLRTPPCLNYWPPIGAATTYQGVGVNPNMSTTENPTRPHLLAAYRGHHQVLRWGLTQMCLLLRTLPGLTYWPPTGATTR
jgi:hypothetical protein